ncbi:unnamed protein product [Polarella glacialis]|uniref:Ion transport domain-containing protein n=1 Tax=Polarella glacialis TaxID=89957 RepID=A0A813IL09_POLGL|nr:unnamed protein product [Polarella glacialis]
MRVLTVFRGFSYFGSKAFAIEHALAAAQVFVFILVIIFLGFISAYVALTISDPEKSVLESTYLMYRLGFIGETDCSLWNSSSSPKSQDNKFIVRVMLMVIGLAMTITMMNIFIGVLSQSYAEAIKASRYAFQRERAHMLLVCCARQTAIDRLKACLCACLSCACCRASSRASVSWLQ